MTTIGFLLDEHIPLVIRERLKQSVPVMRVFVIGDDGAPPKGTPDSDLLIWELAQPDEFRDQIIYLPL